MGTNVQFTCPKMKTLRAGAGGPRPPGERDTAVRSQQRNTGTVWLAGWYATCMGPYTAEAGADADLGKMQ
ncbi:hypothetical protein JCM4814A_03320 [Streptomyces phaeofaciens JCM 4814]|uniref:Uncharacterized protein n=1 Tax=Streptomyces phaeofaciens TaxID=68254 RepID=A0A918HR74_9ACTN|nr:hypothetical protein GCM10010226_88980 [Streptomyces phaeofaciens]